MTNIEKVAWQWLFQQPALKSYEVRVKPVDFKLASLVNAVICQPIILYVTERRSVLYSKAGCPKDACLKSALRDLKEATAQ